MSNNRTETNLATRLGLQSGVHWREVVLPDALGVMKLDGYWFRSARFEVEPGEDKEINPGIYGKQLAEWLKARLEERGYKIEPIINEDWGRCLMCSRDRFLLWVGCANMTDLSEPVDRVP